MEPRRDFQFNPSTADKIDNDYTWTGPEDFLRSMGGPMPKMASPREVRQEAKENSRKIFAKYDQLKKIMERHEATIQKRWVKKTRQQRLHILLQAWPDMPASHRPDFEAFRNESKEQRESGTKYQGHFMWPWINQEDLSQPKSMLLLLNARARHPPPDFAAADSQAIHLGYVSKAIVPDFLNVYTMVLHRATNADEYGELLSWDSHPDAFNWLHTRKQFLPGEGLVVLQVQVRVLEFLVDCCHEILHEIPPDAMISEAYPIQPEPSLKTDVDASGFVSLATMAAEAPYRLPARFDLAGLKSLLQAKMQAAEDHVWALREDPAYYVEQLLETKDHRQEMLKDTQGRAHPVTDKVRENTFWARIIGTTVLDAYVNLETFTELHRLAHKARLLQKKYEGMIAPTDDLPADFLLALLRFRYFLTNSTKTFLQKLKLVVVASPPMRKFFVRSPPSDVNSSKILTMSRTGMTLNNSEENLLWLLRTLWEDDFSLFLIRLPELMDELERLLQTDSHADSLISTHVLNILGDLSIVSQCLRQLDLFQPWALGFEVAGFNHEEDFKKQFATWGAPWALVRSSLREQNIQMAAKLGEPIPGRFTYPFAKRRTKETVEALRHAESNLDMFWAKVDEAVQPRRDLLDGTALHRLLYQQRILRRTAEWVEPEPTTAKANAQPALDPDVSALNRPLSNLFLDFPVAKFTFPKAPLKAKKKTKGIASQPDRVPLPLPKEPESQDPKPTLPVDARALKVFRTLFYNPEVTSTPGTIPWNDFLHAMVSTGFSVEKLYGSVWQFLPTGSDVPRGIHFHEPHPSGKIPFEVARRHGRRLTRAYGWLGSTFVLNK